MNEPWLLTVACAAVTYLSRALGVPLSGRLRTDSAVFNWITCVTYAMVAALIARIVVFPTGLLATSVLPDRVLACAAGLAVYFACRRAPIFGVATGIGVLIACVYLRG